MQQRGLHLWELDMSIGERKYSRAPPNNVIVSFFFLRCLFLSPG